MGIILSLIAPSFLPLPSGASRWPLLYRVEKYFIFSSGSSPPERFRVFSHIIILPHHVCFQADSETPWGNRRVTSSNKNVGPVACRPPRMQHLYTDLLIL